MTPRPDTQADVALTKVDREEWANLSHGFSDLNYRQVWEYGEVAAARNGAAVEHVAMRSDGETVAAAQVRLRRLPVVGGGVAYVGGGPLSRRADSRDAAGAQQAALALIKEYVHRRGLTLRIMAPLADDAWSRDADDRMQSLGFRRAPFPKPYRTIAVDTSRPLEEIRQGFSKNWRKNLRRGEQRGVTLRQSNETDVFDHVLPLYRELLDRKGFDVELDAVFYEKAHRAMRENERFTVILAESDGAVCGMNVVSALGDTLVGIIGATTYQGAKRYAAYLLEWEAMRMAHEAGMRFYDLGGIDPDDNPGGYDFKRGTRGCDLTASGPWEMTPGGVRGALTSQSERLYRSLRRWMSGSSSQASLNGDREKQG